MSKRTTYGAPCTDPECGAAGCWSNFCRGEGCTCAGCATAGQPDPRIEGVAWAGKAQPPLARHQPPAKNAR